MGNCVGMSYCSKIIMNGTMKDISVGNENDKILNNGISLYAKQPIFSKLIIFEIRIKKFLSYHNKLFSFQ